MATFIYPPTSTGATAAADVSYDNTFSGLTATEVQAAIDELAANSSSSAGISGAVQFSDGAGGFLADATKFFWENVSGTLAVGGAYQAGQGQLQVTAAISNSNVISLIGPPTEGSLSVGTLDASFGNGTFIQSSDLSTATPLYLQRQGGGLYLGAASPNGLLWPDVDGTSGQVLTTDGATNLSWTTPASGANTALSNLASTSISTALLPSSDNAITMGQLSGVGGQRRWATIYGTNFSAGDASQGSTLTFNGTNPFGLTGPGVYTSSVGAGTGGRFSVFTSDNANADAIESGQLFLGSGNKTAGTGNSGNVNIRTGSSVGGLRGEITLDANRINANYGVMKFFSSAADPVVVTASAGDVYYNSTGNELKFYNGSAWASFGAGANTALSNLTSPTDINQTLRPATDLTYNLGSSTRQWSNVYASVLRLNDSTGALVSSATSPSGATLAGALYPADQLSHVGLYTNNSSTNSAPSGSIYFETGNKTGASTQASGDIFSRTGSTITGTSGENNIWTGDSSAGASGLISIRPGSAVNADSRGVVEVASFRAAFTEGVVRAYNSAGAPTDLTTYLAGDIYYDTTLNALRVYGAAGWETITSV